MTKGGGAVNAAARPPALCSGEKQLRLFEETDPPARGTKIVIPASAQ